MATFSAIFIANSPLYAEYQNFFENKVFLGIGSYIFSMSIRSWIDEFFMTLFFLVIGLEMKREWISGHLSSPSQRLLPIAAAISGMIFPALIYIAFNYSDPVLLKGWAIPAATDIAFAISILTLIGRGIPQSLRIFLTALAVIDDLGAICIIALFYSKAIYVDCLVQAFVLIVLMHWHAKYKYFSMFIHLILGLVLWYLFWKSGVHSTISGVIVGMLTPIFHAKFADRSPLLWLETKLYGVVTYVILPVFALANGGLRLVDASFNMFFHPVTLGIGFGLFVGKQVGVMAVMFLFKKLGQLRKSIDASIGEIYAVSQLCGIGFTMSLFIAIMSFNKLDPLLQQARLGVLLGSGLSGLSAYVSMKFLRRM
jgi:NhaA family Na+:H+ antiporter